MRKQLRLLSVVLPFTVSSLVAAARLPEADARARLEAEGMQEILLVKVADGFEWTGRSPADEACRGTVASEGPGSTTWRVTRTCAAP
ncbi:MAG: hypothetical protein FJ096_12120 [Deltaproteobacteria bacterium]|nr:hypothetical protein [Deltaproteobacteria bacterium]